MLSDLKSVRTYQLYFYYDIDNVYRGLKLLFVRYFVSSPHVLELNLIEGYVCSIIYQGENPSEVRSTQLLLSCIRGAVGEFVNMSQIAVGFYFLFRIRILLEKALFLSLQGKLL